MNAPATDPRTAALANALHLMNRHFGSTHTPADFMAEAAADLARLDAEPRPLESDDVSEPWTRADAAAEYRAELDRDDASRWSAAA